MTGATATKPNPRGNRRRPSRMIGATAGFLALCLSVYAVFGAIWGFLRPGYEAVVSTDGELQLTPAFNVEFTGFISFVIATGLLGAILSLVMFVNSPHSRGVLMLLWVIVCAVIGAVVFWAAGEVVTGLLHPIPDFDTLDAGTALTLVPGISIGIGLAAAPFMAALAYWCAVLVSPEELTPEEAASRAMFSAAMGSPAGDPRHSTPQAEPGSADR